jgi:hypothetical protein
MKNTGKLLAFAGALTALTVSTGCTVLPGAMLGSNLWGDQNLFNQGIDRGLAGNAVVCLGSDAPVEAGLATYEFAGELIPFDWDAQAPEAFDNLVPCWTDVDYVTQVEDADGNTWTIGHAWLDSDGWDMTPTIWQDGHVEVLVRNVQDSDAAGVVVTQRGSTLYAMESGRGGSALHAGDVPGMDVSTRDSSGITVNDNCGERTTLSIEFQTDDDRLVLYPGEDEGLSIDGEYYTTCSIESVEYDDPCDDSPSETSWVMFK